MKKIPTVFEYFSYMTLFTGAVPVYDYYDYNLFISQEKQYKNIPNTILPTLRIFIYMCLVWIPAMLFLWPTFACELMLTDEFRDSSFLYKVYHFHMASIFWRSKYFVGFLLGDMAVRIIGLSYNGKDSNGNDKWNRMVGINSMIEF